ncbi:MAG: LysR family transcriptional regulator [Chloroflexi bacterium]|nr:LysR family transcriptional regulator [Chloroflexota bacterium]MDA8188879.1 LysR family transcriptional regulator [Dehalococcoidales bacterium]
MANELAPGRKLKTRDLAPSDLADLKPRSKIWIERSGEVVMSDWRMALLEAIARTGSLAKAAEEMGVPYRSAWQKIKESEERLGMRLVDTQCGGADGGSSQLTEAANDLLFRYRQLSEGISELVDKRFRESFC